MENKKCSKPPTISNLALPHVQTYPHTHNHGQHLCGIDPTTRKLEENHHPNKCLESKRHHKPPTGNAPVIQHFELWKITIY